MSDSLIIKKIVGHKTDETATDKIHRARYHVLFRNNTKKWIYLDEIDVLNKINER